MMSVKMQGPVPAHGYGFGEKKEQQRAGPNSGHTAPAKAKNPYINDNQLPQNLPLHKKLIFDPLSKDRS